MSNENLSIEMSQKNDASLITTKTVLTFAEACIYTGYTKSFMYKQTSQRKIPHYKPEGKMIYFERAELEKWLLRNRIKPASEIDEQASTYVTLNQKGGAK
jgi:excisionase family DNA binding protein